MDQESPTPPPRDHKKVTKVRVMINDTIIDDNDDNDSLPAVPPPPAQTQRRGSLFPINQKKKQAQSRWQHVINMVSPTSSQLMNNANHRKIMIPEAFLLAARKSQGGGSFDAFMTRVNRRRSSGKVSIRRGSLFSTGSDKKEPVTPQVDKVKCRRKFQMWIQVVTALVKIRRKCFEEMWGESTTSYREQSDTIDRLMSKTSEQIQHYSDFDANEYKANKQMRMSAKAKEILVKPPEQRTDAEVYYATIALRGIPLIAEYPVRMQKKLAKFGQFECFEAKRPIVKQHHPPFAFYFILFGTVIIAVRPDDVQDAKTVVRLHRGESFGELSIMNDTPRQSTVITQDYCEFLSIDVKTYQNMFMVGGSKNINDPDHNAFIESLYFLKGWPKELLQNNQEYVKFVFFNRDAVITKDSNYSDWIIIIKSGSVQVLKKLEKLLPTLNTKTGKMAYLPSPRDLHLAFLTDASEYYRLLAKTNKQSINVTPRLTPNIGLLTEKRLTPEIELVLSRGGGGGAPQVVNRSQSAALIRMKTPQRKVSTASRSKNLRHSKSARTMEMAKNNTPVVNGFTFNEPEEEELQIEPPEDMVQTGRRTYLDDLDAGNTERKHIRTAADRNPEFVHVQTLTKGDVFGLNPLVFTEQPSLCLVSNGCECILIRKKFYFEHCPTDLRIRLKNQLSPYPDDTVLQKDLQTRVNWDAYKKVTMSNLLHRQPMPKAHLTGWA